MAATKPAPSGLTSPPLSPRPISLNDHPSSTIGSSSSSSSSTLLSSSLLPPALGPRITLRKPIPLVNTNNLKAATQSEDEDEDDDNEEVEDYDPDEVQLDIGSDSDDNLNEAEVGEDDGDEANESHLRGPSSSSTSSSIPLSQMNALLHELHFSHRRLRPAPPQPPPTIPVLTSSTSIVSSSKVPSTSPMRAVPSAKGLDVSDVTAIVPAMDRRAVEAAKAAAARREKMQKEKGLSSSAAATEQSAKEISSPPVEQSNVGAQYEETNRYVVLHACFRWSIEHGALLTSLSLLLSIRLLGALFLSRRRHMNVADEDKDDL